MKTEQIFYILEHHEGSGGSVVGTCHTVVQKNPEHTHLLRTQLTPKLLTIDKILIIRLLKYLK